MHATVSANRNMRDIVDSSFMVVDVCKGALKTTHIKGIDSD